MSGRTIRLLHQQPLFARRYVAEVVIVIGQVFRQGSVGLRRLFRCGGIWHGKLGEAFAIACLGSKREACGPDRPRGEDPKEFFERAEPVRYFGADLVVRVQDDAVTGGLQPLLRKSARE